MRNHFMRWSGFSVMAAVIFGLLSDASATNTAPVGGGSTRAGFDGEYFANPDFKGPPAFTRRDVRINFDWKEGAAGKGLPVGGATTPGMVDFPRDDFSIRWTGAVVPRFSETYTFRLTGKDGLRFTLNGKVLADSLGAGVVKEVTVPLKAGEKAELVFEYVDRANTGASEAKLEWSSPSTPREVIDPLSYAQICDANTGGLHQEFADMKWCASSWGGLKNNTKLTAEEVDDNGWPTVPDFRLPLVRQYTGLHRVSFKGQAKVSAQSCKGTWYLSEDGSGEKFANVLPKGKGFSGQDGVTTAWFDLTEPGRAIPGFTFQESVRPDGKPGLLELEIHGPVKDGSREYNPPGQIRIQEGLEVMKDFALERLHIGSSQNKVWKWEERSLPSYHAVGKAIVWDASAAGVCHEKYIMKVNESGKDWHLCIGAGWDQDYMRKFALMIRYGSDGVNPYDHYVENPKYPPLNPNLRIYLEHANELPWAVYPRFIHDDLKKKAAENHPDWKIVNYDGRCNGADYTATQRYHALRMKQLSDAFREVYRDVPGAIGDRARVLCFGQYSAMRMNEMLQFLDSYFNKADPKSAYEGEPQPTSHYLWGGGGAIYWGSGNRFGLQEKEPLGDSGFEEVPVADGTAALREGTSGWTFTGNAGICDVKIVRQPALTAKTLPAEPAKPLAKDSWVGCKFTVGDKDLYVYQLGRQVIKGNRLGHDVAIFTEDGQMLTDVSVNVSGVAPGSFAYAWCDSKAWGQDKLVPRLLQAGKTYYLVSKEQKGAAADRFFGSDTEVAAAPGLTVQAAVSAPFSASVKNWQEEPGSRSFGPVNMIFTDQVLSTDAGRVGVPPDNSGPGTLVKNNKGEGFNFGQQCAFLQDESSMSREFTVDQAGAYWITFNAAMDMGSNKFQKYNWGGWGVGQGEGTIRILIDGQDVTPKLLPIGGYMSAFHVFHYMASPTFRLEPGKHTVTFERVNAKGGTVFLDEVHLSSEMAFYGGPAAPNFPAGGRALGQTDSSSGAYYKNARSESDMSRNWGLVPMTYEGGWAVQGDFDFYSYLAWNDLRYGSAAATAQLTRQALNNAFNIWCEQGGYMYAYYYPVAAKVSDLNAPLLQAIREFNDRLPNEPVNGTPVPASLTCENDHYQNNPNNDYYGFNASIKKAGPLLPANAWKSWVVIVPETADYPILVDASAGGTFQLDVDGFKVASGKTGDDSIKASVVRLTKGQHAIKVRNTGGLYFLKAVLVGKPGQQPVRSKEGGLDFPARPVDAAIDISAACNRAIEDNVDPGEEGGGFAGFGKDTCFRGLKPGKTDFGYKLVTFDLVDPAKTGGKGCVLLSGPQRVDAFPKTSAPIAVGRKAQVLYFLHTALYTKAKPGEPLVSYRIRYGDGSETVFECKNRVSLGDWWGLPNLENGMTVYNESNRALMLTPWKNPHPDKAIQSVTMESTGKAIPALFGITAADGLAEYEVLMKILN